MNYAILLTSLLLSSPVIAADVWLCEDVNGRRYQVSQNVPSDSCKKLADDEVMHDPASIKLPERSNPKWGVEAFCRSQKPGTCEVSRDALERGSLNGAWFRLFSDSAVVAGAKGHMPDSAYGSINWSVNCSRDKMSSARSCLVSKDDLYVFVRAGGQVLVSVGNHHFPGSQSSIKIGAQRFDTNHRDGNFSNSKQLVGLMKNGAPVVTRYMKWPYRTWEDKEFTSYGLGTAVQVAKWIIAKGDM